MKYIPGLNGRWTDQVQPLEIAFSPFKYIVLISFKRDRKTVRWLLCSFINGSRRHNQINNKNQQTNCLFFVCSWNFSAARECIPKKKKNSCKRAEYVNMLITCNYRCRNYTRNGELNEKRNDEIAARTHTDHDMHDNWAVARQSEWLGKWHI